MSIFDWARFIILVLDYNGLLKQFIKSCNFLIGVKLQTYFLLRFNWKHLL